MLLIARTYLCTHIYRFCRCSITSNNCIHNLIRFVYLLRIFLNWYKNKNEQRETKLVSVQNIFFIQFQLECSNKERHRRNHLCRLGKLALLEVIRYLPIPKKKNKENII